MNALPPGQDIGIYGNSTANGGSWAGYFDGDVNINGNGYFYGTMAIISDKRFKTNINPLSNITEKLKNLKGYTYDYRINEFKSKNFPKTQQIGFIAQEMKDVFPQLVVENKEGYYAVNYIGFIPVLLQAAKEQQAQIDNQQQQINELKALVNSLAGNTSSDAKVGTTTTVPVTLSDKNVVVLNQNVPNPFAESTVISYNVPSDFVKAQIIFTTDNGTVIKSINIKEKGQGTLNVFANDLSHGMYSYTLVIDGKNVATKKMIKE